MKYLDTSKFLLLYISIFTLPMYMRLNNAILAVFIIVALLASIKQRNAGRLWKRLPVAWPVLALFFLAVLACLRSFDLESFRSMERFLSLLFLPFVLMGDPKGYHQRRDQLFLALTYGCLATLAICYGNVFWTMISEGDSLTQIFQAKYTGSRFTDFADTHPAYLGLFILTGIAFLLQEKNMNAKDKILHMLFLALGLFQLAGRTAILLFLILTIYLLITQVRYYMWQVIVLIASMSLITWAYMNAGSKYMEKRLFSIEAYTDANRIERWKVSYDIFRENPLIGVGYKRVRELRAELYRERDLPFGKKGDYNAHNQFLEYLSTNGALGGFLYVIGLMYLLLYSLYKRDLLFVLLFSGFLIANMTESMLVRIKGIEYFAIFATVFLCGVYADPEKDKAAISRETGFSRPKSGGSGQGAS